MSTFKPATPIHRAAIGLSFCATALLGADAALADDRLSPNLRIGDETRGEMYYWTDKCTGEEHKSRSAPTARTPREKAYLKKCVDNISVSDTIDAPTISSKRRKPL